MCSLQSSLRLRLRLRLWGRTVAGGWVWEALRLWAAAAATATARVRQSLLALGTVTHTHTHTGMHNIVVLISGNGSNLQAIIDAVAAGRLPTARVSLVVSNKAGAFGLERAKKAAIPTLVKTLKSVKDQGKTRVDYDIELAADIKATLGRLAASSSSSSSAAGDSAALPVTPDLVVLAGFMHILSPDFISSFPQGRIINLHPRCLAHSTARMPLTAPLTASSAARSPTRASWCTRSFPKSTVARSLCSGLCPSSSPTRSRRSRSAFIPMSTHCSLRASSRCWPPFLCCDFPASHFYKTQRLCLDLSSAGMSPIYSLESFRRLIRATAANQSSGCACNKRPSIGFAS
ncbi:formyl transferase-domain-containing protein [Entophlyctis helioformis]|nr:formyl transferase-domain-containing protein [Entophlyctis helioformis]